MGTVQARLHDYGFCSSFLLSLLVCPRAANEQAPAQGTLGTTGTGEREREKEIYWISKSIISAAWPEWAGSKKVNLLI